MIRAARTFATLLVPAVLVAPLVPGAARAEETLDDVVKRLREVEARNELLEERLRRVEQAPSRAEKAAEPTDRPLEGQPAPTRPQAEPPLEDRVAEIVKSLRDFPRSKVDRLELHALVDGSFVWNTNDPPFRKDANRLRVDDPDHDSFELTYAKLGACRTVSGKDEWDAGFNLEVGAGRLAQTTLSLDPNFGPNSPIQIAQGYVDLQVPTPLNPLLIRFGRFYGWFGVESLDVPSNPNFSLSWFSNFTPFTNTGVSVGMDLGLGFRYTQYLVNGWDLVIDNNDAKSVGGQLAWTLADPSLVVALNWMYGAERDDNDHDHRQLYQLDVTFRPVDGTELRGSIHWGQEEGADVKTGGVAKYGGVMLIFRQEFYEVEPGFRRFAVAARGTYWRDQGGSKTGLDQALWEGTGTFTVQFTRFAGLRFEYRHDFSSRDHFFIGKSGLPTRGDQGTLSVDAYFNF